MRMMWVWVKGNRLGGCVDAGKEGGVDVGGRESMGERVGGVDA